MIKDFVINSWDGIMNQWYNPLKYIPDLQVRHMILQILAWLWCIAFSLYFTSWFVFGVTVVAHFVLIAAIVVTVATFRISENVYRFKEGYHSMGRARGSVLYRGKDGTVYKVSSATDCSTVANNVAFKE